MEQYYRSSSAVHEMSVDVMQQMGFLISNKQQNNV